jgi:hypothetical protein
MLPQHLTMEYEMTMRPILGKSNAGSMFGNLGGQRCDQNQQANNARQVQQ